MRFFLGILAVIAATNSEKLPPYIKKCNILDIEINDCITKNANKAIPSITKGDPNYDFLKMNPLKQDMIVFKNDDQFQFIMKNVEVHGLEKVHIDNTLFNPTSQTSGIIMSTPSLSFVGDYIMKGSFLGSSIHGKGPGNMTLVNVILKWIPVIEIKKKKGPFFEITGEETTCSCTRSLYKFDDLFDDNQNQSEKINKYLNANWGNVFQMLESGIERYLGGVITHTCKGITERVSINDIFITK